MNIILLYLMTSISWHRNYEEFTIYGRSINVIYLICLIKKEIINSCKSDYYLFLSISLSFYIYGMYTWGLRGCLMRVFAIRDDYVRNYLVN